MYRFEGLKIIFRVLNIVIEVFEEPLHFLVLRFDIVIELFHAHKTLHIIRLVSIVIASYPQLFVSGEIHDLLTQIDYFGQTEGCSAAFEQIADVYEKCIEVTAYSWLAISLAS